MSIFDLFRKRKRELSSEELKWNKMWQMWVDEEAISPYAELMTYESEVNNGGHAQFFDNVSNTADLAKAVEALLGILKGALHDNLKRAYDAFLEFDEESYEEGDPIDAIMDECDRVFYENEDEIERLLKEYASTVEL